VPLAGCVCEHYGFPSVCHWKPFSRHAHTPLFGSSFTLRLVPACTMDLPLYMHFCLTPLSTPGSYDVTFVHAGSGLRTKDISSAFLHAVHTTHIIWVTVTRPPLDTRSPLHFLTPIRCFSSRIHEPRTFTAHSSSHVCLTCTCHIAAHAIAFTHLHLPPFLYVHSPFTLSPHRRTFLTHHSRTVHTLLFFLDYSFLLDMDLFARLCIHIP